MIMTRFVLMLIVGFILWIGLIMWSGCLKADMTDFITRAAIADAKVSSISVDGVKYLVVAKNKWFGGRACYFMDIAADTACLANLSGDEYVRDLPIKFPQCVTKAENMPPAVTRECFRLAPPTVVSYITGSRPLYDGHAIYVWHTSGKVGSIPKIKKGTVATQTPCGPDAAGTDTNGTVWWWTTNAEGLAGAAYCK